MKFEYTYKNQVESVEPKFKKALVLELDPIIKEFKEEVWAKSKVALAMFADVKKIESIVESKQPMLKKIADE